LQPRKITVALAVAVDVRLLILVLALIHSAGADRIDDASAVSVRNVSGKPGALPEPRRVFISDALTPGTLTCTRISPGPGSGMDRSPIFRTVRAGPLSS
jgi:hypothetical protein